MATQATDDGTVTSRRRRSHKRYSRLTEASVESDISQQSAGANANGPQIIADRNNSALVVVATEAEYATIEGAIRKLDVMPMQVLIEATIAEVTLNNALQYGTQFFLNSQGQVMLSNAVSPSPTVINPTSSATPSSFRGYWRRTFPALRSRAPSASSNSRCRRSRTSPTCRSSRRPNCSSSTNSRRGFRSATLSPRSPRRATSVIASDAPVVNSIQYQATGVILTVTPRINAGGLVTLDIEQEVSDVVPTTSSDINSPTFQQRRIQTKVVVQDGETISLGGLISDKTVQGQFGHSAAAGHSDPRRAVLDAHQQTLRTELLILLTPRVVNDQRDARALTEELRRKLSPSGLVPCCRTGS